MKNWFKTFKTPAPGYYLETNGTEWRYHYSNYSNASETTFKHRWQACRMTWWHHYTALEQERKKTWYKEDDAHGVLLRLVKEKQ